MNITPKTRFRKIPQNFAVEIIERYQVNRELRDTISPVASPAELISDWLNQQQFNEVVTLLCHALPAREAIWWGCLCVRMVSNSARNALPADQQQALEAAECWVQEPTEANRRIAEVRAKKAELECAAGWLAQSVFWSGGSITPVDAPASPAPDYLYSHAVAGAICLAAVLPDGQRVQTYDYSPTRNQRNASPDNQFRMELATVGSAR